MKDEVIKQISSFNKLLSEFSSNINTARYEQFLIKLATAYDGYQFDLPAFLDFRGRIYRKGLFHFHERDLARSLIVFANSGKLYANTIIYDINHMFDPFLSSISFHYKSFVTIEKGKEWFNSNLNEIGKNPI